MTDPAGIPALVDAIRHLHDCGAKHVETVHVREVAPTGEMAWEGVYGYPLPKTAHVAVKAVLNAVTRVQHVRFVLFDAEAHRAFRERWGRVKASPPGRL